jgi:hypothetical protein
MTVVSNDMETSELVAFLREADDFAQFVDIESAAVREAVRIAIDRLAALVPKDYNELHNLIRGYGYTTNGQTADLVEAILYNRHASDMNAEEEYE